MRSANNAKQLSLRKSILLLITKKLIRAELIKAAKKVEDGFSGDKVTADFNVG